MLSHILLNVLAAAAPLGPANIPAPEVHSLQTNHSQIEQFKIDEQLTLRRQIVRNPRPKGTVLLLHGFPETLLTWEEVARSLGSDYEVHAFDWPGFGQSSRPPVERFSYSPRDYAKLIREYIRAAGIERSKLTIYATDIGALPVLLAALDDPEIARTIIVGDFAPFNRPAFMHERLERLKSRPSADVARVQLNASRDDTIENAFKRGLPAASQFEISPGFKADMIKGWGSAGLTSADAFYHYYSHFTRDQDYFEANLERLKTPVKIVWGDADLYIRKEMGVELATRLKVEFTALPGVGHYPHLQSPEKTVAEIRASLP